MTSPRLLKALGGAAASARGVGLGRALNVGIDTIDAVLLRAGAPILKASNGSVELRGFLRHRGFLAYVSNGMQEESYYRRLLVAAVDSHTTFVDAGAHIGVYTLLTCSRARRVIAFEPDPYNLAALERNVKDSACANVEIRAEAVADRATQTAFRAFRSTFSGSLAPREVDAYQELEVKTIALDDVLADADLGSLVVKLDVEGAEPLALAGMRKAIRRARKLTIFAEVNPEALEAGGSSAERLIEDFFKTDLTCSSIDEKKRALEPLRVASSAKKANILCWKQAPRPCAAPGPGCDPIVH